MDNPRMHCWLAVVSAVCFFGIGTVIAAPRQTNSLTQEFKTATTDSARIAILTEMARRVPHSDSAKALTLWKQVLDLAVRSRDPLSEAKTYLNIGSWHYDHYRTDEADRYNRRVQELTEHDTARNARVLYAKSQINAANIAWQRNRVDDALSGYLDVLPLLNQLADMESLALINTNIGILFNNQQQYDKSAHYFLAAADQYKQLTPIRHSDIADIYIILAGHGLRTDNLPDAPPDTYNGQGNAYLDSALHYLLSLDGRHRKWADYYNMKGRYQLASGDLTGAEQAFRRGLPIARQYNDTYTSCDILLHLSELYERRGEFAKTRPLLDELLQTSQTNQVGTYQLKALRALSRMEHRLKQPDRAYRYLAQYIDLADSLHYVENTKTLHEMEEKYKLAEAENNVLMLQRENEQKDFAIERNRWYIGLLLGISIPLLATCILIFLLYRNKRKLLVQQQRVHALDVERMEQVHRNSLLSALLEGQEKERERLARDLHDGLGGILSSIKMDLSRIAHALPEDVAQRPMLASVASNVDGAVEELRGIAHSMMPSMLVKYGLVEALREFCDKLKRAGVPVFYQVIHYRQPVARSREMALYRIAQELINNCVKHAEATEILVQLQQSDATVTLVVEDDGRGFDTARSRSGAGLRNVGMRTDLLEGTFDIRSDNGVGTTFTVECPISATLVSARIPSPV
ncbi:Signal transduction histidine kinase [Parapedobacter composti]|uniref:Signal transduction histidine kinase n=1 Tax=Parapedobacter composti TaxID=623281 RepID=A0A1I1F2W5_9SPHI|nr:ATP-binding protein [Parapedobacter composti]SFB91510.1 Signal transduction histidine kinase [Parapedobacter composti]